MDVSSEEFVACPQSGRQFTSTWAVRLGDVNGSGRLRLDALARALQDVAADDGDELGLTGAGAWVLRRTLLRLKGLPRFRDVAELTTFCSGIGPRWAERRSTVRVGGRVAVESAAVWVYVDDAGRPTPIDPWFHEHYGSAAGGRRVSARLRLPGPSPSADAEPWPLRAADFDILGHVNNAVASAAVEDALARHAGGEDRLSEDRLSEDRLLGATLEYRAPIDPGDTPELVSESAPGHVSCWLCCAGDVRVAARIDLDAGARGHG